ncbi:MAG: [citrate (pro-3S)-lyase] ligase [Bacilli bacterium]
MNYNIKEVITNYDRKKVASFLKDFGFKYENVDFSIYIEIEKEVIATVSARHNIITFFAIKQEFQAENIAGYLLSYMINHLATIGIDHLFIYTTLKYYNYFENMGFKVILLTDEVAVLESNNYDISEELNKIKVKYFLNEDKYNAVCLNANPFTNGHLHLINSILKQGLPLIVFVLEEDKSFFSFFDRFNMVKLGLKKVDKVTVVPSTYYLISNLTFPTYFLKNDLDKVKVEGMVDALIFKNYFMKIFNIQKRIVGEEIDPTTNSYNEVLKEVLKDDLIIIPRKKVSGDIISASLVREKYKIKDFESISSFVPKSVVAYLKVLRNNYG